MRLYLRETQPPRQISRGRALLVILAQPGFQGTSLAGLLGVCLTAYLFRPSDLPGLLLLPGCRHVSIASARITSISPTLATRPRSSANDHFNIERVAFQFTDAAGRERVGHGYRTEMTGPTAQKFGVGGSARLSVKYCRDRPWACQMDSTTPTMHESPWPIGGVMIALLIGAWISFGVYIRRGITLVSWLQQGSYALGTKPVIGARPVFPSDANVHTMVIGYQDSAGKPQICCAKTKKPEVLLCIERPMVLFRSKPDGTKEAILADMIPGMDEMEEMDHDVAAARRFAMKYCCLPTLCLAGHLAYGLASLLALLIGAYAW